MKDRFLESFIEEHREEFDSDRPSLKVWANIEKGLNKGHQKQKLRALWRRSAAAILLLLIGAALGAIAYPRIQEQQALQALNNSTEISEMEVFFNQEIEVRLAALTHPDQVPEVKNSLSEIDRNIQKLKLDLIYAPKSTREEMMQAIISSYELKIHVLQTALESISPVNTKNYESHII